MQLTILCACSWHNS